MLLQSYRNQNICQTNGEKHICWNVYISFLMVMWQSRLVDGSFVFNFVFNFPFSEFKWDFL